MLNKAQEYQSLQVADVAESMLHKRAGQEECRISTRPQPTAELLARQRFSVPELRKKIELLKDVCLQDKDLLDLKEIDCYATIMAYFNNVILSDHQ